MSDTEFEAVEATIEPIEDMEIAGKPADEVVVEETTTKILARLATLRSLGTAVDRLGLLEVFSERWEEECETILKDLMESGLKEDPKDSRFTWKEDENGNDSNSKIGDWDDDLDYKRALLPGRLLR